MLTIKDHLFNLIRGFFDHQIKFIQYNERLTLEQERRYRIRESETIELSQFVGRPIICISNEWETPKIGFGKRIEFITKAENPILCMHNYLDDKEYLIMGTSFYFTEQRFDALFKLDPFELCSFIYGRYLFDRMDKEKCNELKGKEEVKQLLEVSGFYKRLEKFNQSRKP